MSTGGGWLWGWWSRLLTWVRWVVFVVVTAFHSLVPVVVVVVAVGCGCDKLGGGGWWWRWW